MSSLKFTRLVSQAVLLPIDDVDTDQIIPARYLKVTDKSGLGEGLFAGWRYTSDGISRPEFPSNKAAAQDRAILVSGRNFGCGSSREHAAWALLAAGFRSVIAPSFADIFRNNALKNGLLVVALDPSTHSHLCAQLQENPAAELAIDLRQQSITLPRGERAHFPIDGFSKRCLLEGIDSLGYLLQMDPHIQAYEARHG